MKQLNKLLSAFSTKTLMLLSFFALLPTMASAQCPDNNHPHMIDLGLPSGTKWACCNVGASKPEDYGGYFAWGETEEKDVYDWSTYLYGTYNEDEDYSNLVDIGIDIAGSQYDVAHVQWGASWRMPSQEQVQEFIDNCNSIWGTINGVNGWTFTGPNGSTIFLPAAGLRANEELIGGAEWGQYYSSSLLESYPCTAHIINIFKEEIINLYAAFRYYGFSVRPVVAGSSTPSGNIDFADPAVKAICVANWDTNGDGELSYDEAAAVTDLGNIFSDNQEIKKFNELQYFTGLTSIGERAFDWCTGLTSVIIPNSVTNIGFGAFRDCSSLTSVTIPDNVSSIDTYAFMSCERLTSVTIPNNVTSIGSEAFSGCSGLTSIKVESGNTKYDSRNNCNAIIETNTNILITGCMNTIIPNSVTTIGDFAFYKCSGLISVNIPNSVTSIGNYAFDDCTGLTSVTIPNSVTSIGRSAFQYCTGLTSVTIPNSVTSIGRSVFYWCTGLTEVISLIEEPWGIDESTFMCYDETGESYYPASTLYVPAGTKEKYEATAGWNKFKNIVEMEAPSGNIDFADPAVKALCVANWDTDGDGELSYAEAAAVTDIGTGFANNKDIKSFDELQYFTGVTELSEAAFSFSSNLQSITIPKSVTNIGRLLLIDCENLISIRVDEENSSYDSRDNCNAIIETASNRLISGCMNTVIPNSVESIGDCSFEGHSGLLSITIPNTVKAIEFGAFNSCSGLSSITIPKSVTYIGVSAFANCSGLKTIQVENGNPEYDSRNNCNAIISTNGNALIAGCMSTVIPNTVTSIESFAFCGCTGLTSLDIPNSVISIGYLAFSNCSNLSSVTIPNSVTTIGDAAFQVCSSLSSLEIPNSVTTIGSSAFTCCTSLTSITIPESVANIGDGAFSCCESMEKVFSYIKEPFEIASDAFSTDWEKNTATLYVPVGCKEIYENTAGWNKFANIVEMGASSGIAIDATNFPDENFRNWVLSRDFGQDGVLTEEEIAGVKEIDVGYKSITDLKGIEYFTALTTLYCYDNQLTYLDVSKNTALTLLSCQENQINETEMGNLVESLPANNGSFYVKRLDVSNEQNIITTEQVEAAKAKGWRVCAFDDGVWTEYDGDELQDISPVNEGETIDIGNEIDENTNLDGNVVGDVYYSISSGDGNYDAAEGCLVVTKPTDDSAIDGQDIFGEDFKDNYTGIVFKLAPGKGTIKVEAETQGNMVLKVKIGNNEPIEMELDGKLKVKFPYNVSEPTYVYIYGGMGAAGAKAMGANRAKSAADLLKIYGFEIVSDPSGIDAIENGQQQDAPVYNLNGQRVNTPGKGIYIKNGRKVLMK